MSKVIPIASARPEADAQPDAPAGDTEESLYAVRRKIYPRAVEGWFATWRWVFVFATQLVFYGTPWLMWNDRQAVLFDLGARKFYILGIVFWPQDFIYLSVLLLISAFSLFLFTAVAGRLWCGYACPQTVYTEIFLWIERVVEGGHLARIKLDQSPVSAKKLARKSAKHALWILFSLWTGFTFVGYFTPIRELGNSAIAFATGPWETFWIFFYGFATYGNAGWLREQVCLYMCPYARFQGVMFDRDTLLIAYDEQRGEPRGARSRKTDHKAKGLGDCIDCNICVQVCPTGIDIRHGQQYECIGCAACIDGCNQVMDKMGYPRGLIRYASLNSVQQHFGWSEMLRRTFRPRVLIYTLLLWSIIIAVGVTLWQRAPVRVDVIRDRGAMAREVGDGLIENVYRLQIMNVQERPQRLRITASGINGVEVFGPVQPLEIEAASSTMLPVTLRAERSSAMRGSNRVFFHIVAVDANGQAAPDRLSLDEAAVFIRPQ
jgi:cytochrome c oxidase accessory protein FixG